MRVSYDRDGKVRGYSDHLPDFFAPTAWIVPAYMLVGILFILLAPLVTYFVYKDSNDDDKPFGPIIIWVIYNLIWVGVMIWLIWGNAFEPVDIIYRG